LRDLVKNKKLEQLKPFASKTIPQAILEQMAAHITTYYQFPVLFFFILLPSTG
jgi:hypothetical protein